MLSRVVSVMKQTPVIILLLASMGAVTLVAQRIFTNPRPDAHLKTLFPSAVAFSPLEGTPLHFKAYAVDPKANPTAQPIGVAFWTTDLVPKEHGYHGPIHMLVGMDMKGVLTGLVVDYNSEPYGYFSVDPPKFAAQFKGKNIRDQFRVGGDIDAVSRASITMNSAARAVRDSSRQVARALLSPDTVKPPDFALGRPLDVARGKQ
jgi:NosR/NirI family transcriptional regulator, nitrous oxide reductase regulator